VLNLTALVVCVMYSCARRLLDDSPVLIQIEYQVEPQNRKPFLRAIHAVETTRRRNGSTSRRVFRHLAEDGRRVERYIIASWGQKNYSFALKDDDPGPNAAGTRRTVSAAWRSDLYLATDWRQPVRCRIDVRDQARAAVVEPKSKRMQR